MPKSIMRSWPLSKSMMFWGLMSRCTTPLAWACSSALRIWEMKCTVSRLVDVCHAAGADQLLHLIQAVQLFADQVVHQRTSSTHSSSAVMLSGPPFSLAVRIRRSGRS
mgnify:CR=1 FL=1